MLQNIFFIPFHWHAENFHFFEFAYFLKKFEIKSQVEIVKGINMRDLDFRNVIDQGDIFYILDCVNNNQLAINRFNIFRWVGDDKIYFRKKFFKLRRKFQGQIEKIQKWIAEDVDCFSGVHIKCEGRASVETCPSG